MSDPATSTIRRQARTNPRGAQEQRGGVRQRDEDADHREAHAPGVDDGGDSRQQHDHGRERRRSVRHSDGDRDVERRFRLDSDLEEPSNEVPPEAARVDCRADPRVKERWARGCAHAAFLRDAPIARDRHSAALAYFLVFLYSGVWLPYGSLYLLHLGWAGWQIGLVLGVQPALRWCGGIVWAYVADRWRIRRQVLVGTALAGSACFVPLLLVTRMGSVAAALTAISLFHGPLIPFVDATVMDHLAVLGGDYGRLRMWGSVGFVLGALASAPAVHAFGPAAVPWLLLAPQLPLVPAIARLPGVQLGHPEHFRPPWRLVTPALAVLLATGFLLNASAGAWAGFFAVHTASLGLTDALPGVAWGLAVTAEVIFLFFSRRVLGRLGPADLILLAMLTTIARWIATALVHGELAVVGVQMAQAFTFAAFHVAALALLARLVPPESSTGGQALYGMVVFGIGGTVGITLAGLLVDRLGTPAVFGVEALVALSALAPALRLRRLLRR